MENPQHRLMKGVYQFHIGELFYIGRTRSFEQRIRAHVRHINYFVQNYARLSNLDTPIDKGRSRAYLHLKVARYVLEHPKIGHLRARMLYACPGTVDMCATEHSLLRLIDGHKDCINAVFSAGIYPDDGHYWHHRVVDGFCYYYQGHSPEDLIPYSAYVRKDGTWRTPLTQGGIMKDVV
jgi:hypothetical protein